MQFKCHTDQWFSVNWCQLVFSFQCEQLWKLQCSSRPHACSAEQQINYNHTEKPASSYSVCVVPKWWVMFYHRDSKVTNKLAHWSWVTQTWSLKDTLELIMKFNSHMKFKVEWIFENLSTWNQKFPHGSVGERESLMCVRLTLCLHVWWWGRVTLTTGGAETAASGTRPLILCCMFLQKKIKILYTHPTQWLTACVDHPHPPCHTLILHRPLPPLNLVDEGQKRAEGHYTSCL